MTYVDQVREKLKSRSITKSERFNLYFCLSDLYHDVDNYIEALEAMKRAIRYKSFASKRKLQTAYNNLGVLSLQLNRPHAAFGYFLNCLRINEWHPIANRLAAEIFISKGYDYPAVFLLVRAARHRYCRLRSLSLIAECLENTGHVKLASDVNRLINDPHSRYYLKSRRMNGFRTFVPVSSTAPQ